MLPSLTRFNENLITEINGLFRRTQSQKNRSVEIIADEMGHALVFHAREESILLSLFPRHFHNRTAEALLKSDETITPMTSIRDLCKQPSHPYSVARLSSVFEREFELWKKFLCKWDVGFSLLYVGFEFFKVLKTGRRNVYQKWTFDTFSLC